MIFVLAMLLLTCISAVAQCDKKIKWQAAKGVLVDETGTVVDTKEGSIVVTTDNKNVKFEILEHDNEMAEGTVSESTCDWKDAFKNGKSTYKATMTGRNGDTTGALFTIEGKDGKLMITIEVERLNGKKIRMVVDKYEVI